MMETITTYDQAVEVAQRSKLSLDLILRSTGVKDLGPVRFRKKVSKTKRLSKLWNLHSNAARREDKDFTLVRIISLAKDEETLDRINHTSCSRVIRNRLYSKMSIISNDVNVLERVLVNTKDEKTKKRAAKKMLRLRTKKNEDYILGFLERESHGLIHEMVEAANRERNEARYKESLASRDIQGLHELHHDLSDDERLAQKVKREQKKICSVLLASKNPSLQKLQLIADSAIDESQKTSAQKMVREIIAARVELATRRKDVDALWKLHEEADYANEDSLKGKILGAILVVTRKKVHLENVIENSPSGSATEKKAVMILARPHVKAVLAEA